MTTQTTVYDFEFSINKQCFICGNRPDDYWNMVMIKVSDDELKKSFARWIEPNETANNMRWICINCLGSRIYNFDNSEKR